MKDFLGQDIAIGDDLAIAKRDNIDASLYAARVVDMHTKPNGKVIVTLKLKSNGYVTTDGPLDYSKSAIITHKFPIPTV